ncbi:MFSD2A [Branchiostoma lanceolatum]|uniref:MFSD2A protein n=1 Tax=Branchiostoma lanceolatum TaxID=7740 RepID=A0A8K0EWS7_BRALA|nr:MFSD2A [Branchiostoma lanceolatum]
MPVEERKPLSVLSKICFGLSGLALEIFLSVLGAYTNVFLVEIAQLPPLFGTSVVFGGRAMDAVFNFILGPLIDRTDTRWGKLKPWILGAGLLLVPVYILLWYVPDVGSEGKLAWYIVLSIFLVFAKTALAVSSRTYVMFLSPASQERDSATAYRGIFSLIGVSAGVAIHGQIVGAYSQAQIDPCAISNDTGAANGTNGTMDNAFLAEEKTGYLVSAGVISVIVVACILAVVVGTTELRDISKTSQQKRNQSLVKMLRTVWTFRPNVIMLMIFFCVQMIQNVLLGAAVLYVQYGMDLPGQIHNSMLAFAVSAAISVPVVGMIVARFDKRIPFMCFQLIRNRTGFVRGVKEAIYIRAHHPSLNRDGGRFRLPAVFDSLRRHHVSDFPAFNAVIRTSDEGVLTSDTPPTMAQLSNRAKLYIKINDDLSEDDIKKLRAMLITDGHLGRTKVENATPLEIFDLLEADNKIGKGNLALIVDLLKALGKTKLAQEAVDIGNETEGA